MMNRPKPLPKPPGGVPIIGNGPPYVDKITFELGGFKLHPPARFDQGYAMLMILMSAGQPARATARAFGVEAAAYLAEDCELGKKHELVLVRPSESGDYEFIVARPREDDPNRIEH